MKTQIVSSSSRYLSFGMRLREDHYSPMYRNNAAYNGSKADSFILSQLQKAFPDASRTLVWDIGSGDGRNTLPIAQAGYRVVSTETSEDGQRLIQDKASQGGFGDNVYLDNSNILEPGLTASGENKQPIHLAILSRVSMHFSLTEMKTVLNNVWQQLAPNGLFIFNALIRKPNYETMHRKYFDSELEGNGCNNFKPEDLQQVIDDSSFITESIGKHRKARKSDPSYMSHLHWGTFCDLLKWESPVWLKWYVLRKPQKINKQRKLMA